MNVALTRAADRLPRRPFTVDDIHRMIEAGIVREDERFELIEGGSRHDVGQAHWA